MIRECMQAPLTPLQLRSQRRDAQVTVALKSSAVHAIGH